MAKAKSAAKKVKPATKAIPAKAAPKPKKVAAAAAAPAPKAKAKLTKVETKAPPKTAAKGRTPLKVAGGPNAASVSVGRGASAPAGRGSVFPGRPKEKVLPRATQLPPVGTLLTKREMEQLLTAGMGRGVVGEGSLKGRLHVRDGLPNLRVIGRDKRELVFVLQGPDQETLPAYADYKVSVSGLIRKTTNYGGTVDVRKYSAKRADAVPPPEPAPESHLKYLSPGEVEQVCNAGMGAGMRGFATMRGNLEMTGEAFFLVVSNGGTRQQVSFLIDGKATKGLRKHVGQVVQVTGVVEKESGWGGKVQAETAEPRLSEHRAISRDAMDVIHVEGSGDGGSAEVKLNHGLTVRLEEKPGFIWAVEPTAAKRMGLREANYEPTSSGPGTREFFFTPRNPGAFEMDFFLAKAFAPAQVSRTFKLAVTVKPQPLGP